MMQDDRQLVTICTAGGHSRVHLTDVLLGADQLAVYGLSVRQAAGRAADIQGAARPHVGRYMRQ